MKKLMTKENLFTGKAMARLRDGKVSLEKKTRNGSDIVTFFAKDGRVPYSITTSIRRRTMFKKGYVQQTDKEIGVPVANMQHRINRLLNDGYVLKIS